MMSMRTLASTAIAALCLAVLGSSAARAQILLDDGNFGGGSSGNVLLAQDWSSVTHMDASLNGAPASLDGIVNVDSNELLNGQGLGQATFTPVDGVLNNICFSLKDGYVFGRFSFNPQGNGPGDGPFKVVVDYLDSSSNPGQMTFDPAGTLGNGENRFGLTAQAGFYMTEVCFYSDSGSDLGKQARILDVAPGVGQPPQEFVPEPGTWAMLTGMCSFAGLVIRRRTLSKP